MYSAIHATHYPPFDSTYVEKHEQVKAVESGHQADLLRDIVGSPFRPPPAFDPTLRTMNGPVVRMAEPAYEERTLPDGTLQPGRLALLADALEGAGSNEFYLLAHLRSPGPHVRGCWALDVVLGKS